MKNLQKALLSLLFVVGFSLGAFAEEDLGKPAITFHTTIYDTNGAENDFSLLFGATSSGLNQVIDIDCGYGTQEAILSAADYDNSTSSSTGTFVSCRVSAEGIVKVYIDDPSWIDWINFSGCYIDEIDLGDLTDLIYLDLSHNELKSLDLSKYTKIQSLYMSDNPFSDSPLVIGPKPLLTILELNSTLNISPDFTLTDYPGLYSFDAWACGGLTSIDASNCPDLIKLSIDGTDVATLDISKNTNLTILNICDTRITHLDLSNNTNLRELYCTHEADLNSAYKLDGLDLSHCPSLIYLFCTGNNFTTLDLTKNTGLRSVTARKNLLTSIDVSQNPDLYCLNISDNYLNFATLPEPNENWTEYAYTQRNIPANLSYKVGDVLDYSSKVLREGTETEGFLYGINEADPLSALVIDSKCYEYADGKVTFKAVPTYNGEAVDSVYMAFTNSMFTETTLKTTTFAVKDAGEFGKPIQRLYFTSEAYSGKAVKFNVGIFGASKENPKEFFVDYGDGNLVSCHATTDDATETNVNGISAGAYVRVYVDENDDVSALGISDLTLYSIDLSQLRSMHTLSLVNTGLYSIDMQWNRSLVNLTLNGNHLSAITLASEDNQSYAKNALTNVDLSNNGTTSFTWNENFTVENLNLSHNSLSELTLSKNVKIQHLDISYNNFDYLNASECSGLLSLNVDHNNFSTITLPEESVLEELVISNNNFTLATLPSHDGLAEEKYIYAPQNDYSIPAKGPSINLTEQSLEGTTVYTLKKVTGEVLTEDVDYTAKDGKFTFINTEVGKVYCEMTNPTYPAFTGDNVYKTTSIEAAGMPEYVVAEFVTPVGGEEVTLTLTSLTENNSLFVDWTGNDDLTQYELATSYKLFDATTTEGATVKVYSYDPVSNISVFSLRNATLSKMDASGLTQLICFNMTNAGLTNDQLILPESSNLNELILPGNYLTSIDLSKYRLLTYLNLADNEFTTFTLADNTNLQQLYLSENKLTEVNFGKNSNLWSIFVDGNELSTIDFSGVPNVRQTTLANNQFSEVNVTDLKQLRYLSLVGNKFTFKTLPRPYEFKNSASMAYYYGNQAELQVVSNDGIVDLSDQAYVEDSATSKVATTYTWIFGEPDYDDYDELVNEVLVQEGQEQDGEDAEYSVEDGICRFYTANDQICCVMTNDVFENLTLVTNLINTAAGVNDINVDNSESYVTVVNRTIQVCAPAGQAVNVYDVNGRQVAATTTVEGTTEIAGLNNGVYIVTLPGYVAKAMVK